MEVYFDYQIFYLQQFGGISRYFLELASELNQLKNCDAKIHASVHRNQLVTEFPTNRYVKSLFRFSPPVSDRLFRLFGRINDIIRNFRIKSDSDIVFHETYYSNCINKNVKNRVITIHDMIPEVCLADIEEFKPLIQQKKRAIERADKIIVDSISTKNDLIRLYPAAEKNVHVVYLGVKAIDINQVRGYQTKTPYILFVGNRDFHKNFSALLQTYVSDDEIHSKFQLICFGGGKFNKTEMDTIEKMGLQENIIQVSGTDDFLNSLYKSAMCLVMPSFYEGFGMPVLEAMAMQCPVICSNRSSLPEIAGDAALMIDPLSEAEMGAAIKALANDPGLRNRLITRGLKNIENFTWKTCAQNTYKVYQSFFEE